MLIHSSEDKRIILKDCPRSSRLCFGLRFHCAARTFDRLKTFYRILCSQGTIQYFCSIHTELWTAGCLNFCTVKVVSCEHGLAFCKIILNFPMISLWRTVVLWRTSHVKRIIYYITWRETIRELEQRHFTRHTPTGSDISFLLETNCSKIWTKPVLKNACSIFGWWRRSIGFVLKFPIDLA